MEAANSDSSVYMLPRPAIRFWSSKSGFISLFLSSSCWNIRGVKESGSGPRGDRPAAVIAGSGVAGGWQLRFSIKDIRPKRRGSTKRNCMLLLRLTMKWVCFSKGSEGGFSKKRPVMPN